MQDSIMMRMTQILERSKIDSPPVAVSFKTKTIWYAFMYWIVQSIVLAAIYRGTTWFLPLFNLVTVGWAWDKITSMNIADSNSNIRDSNIRDSNSNSNSNIRDSNSDIREPHSNRERDVEKSMEASELLLPKVTIKNSDNGLSIIGENANNIDLMFTAMHDHENDDEVVGMNGTIDNIKRALE
jgi:hypothetical protein